MIVETTLEQVSRPSLAGPVATGGRAVAFRNFFRDASKQPYVTRREWTTIQTDLECLRALPEDWDGEGSPPPDRRILDAAEAVARQLRDDFVIGAPGRVHLGVNNTIYFEWQTPVGYLEIEVLSPEFSEVRWLPEGSQNPEVFPLDQW
jgi:hypothetical protein